MNRESISAYHDDLYRKRLEQGIASWDRTPESVLHTQKAFRNLLAKASPPPSSDILEIGCGAGQVTEVLGEFARKVTAIDFSKVAIDLAKNRLLTDAFEFICDDFLQCSLPAERKFQIIVDSHVYHCIVGDDRQAFLTKAHALLAPGGSIILRTMCGPMTALFQEDEKMRIDRAAGIVSIRGQDGEFFPYRHFEAPEAILDRMRASGFHISFSEHFTESNQSLSQDFLAVIAMKDPDSQATFN